MLTYASSAIYVNMADASTLSAPLFLRDAELRRGVEMLYFAYRDFTKGPDRQLERYGFGRAHHRALYFIARKPGLNVSELLGTLQITKQSLGRVLGDMRTAGLVEHREGRDDRRQRHLYLTPDGERLEQELFAVLREAMSRAYNHAGPQAVAGFWAVLDGLIDPA